LHCRLANERLAPAASHASLRVHGYGLRLKDRRAASTRPQGYSMVEASIRRQRLVGITSLFANTNAMTAVGDHHLYSTFAPSRLRACLSRARRSGHGSAPRLPRLHQLRSLARSIDKQKKRQGGHCFRLRTVAGLSPYSSSPTLACGSAMAPSAVGLASLVMALYALGPLSVGRYSTRR
jgi:hypothetical protein